MRNPFGNPWRTRSTRDIYENAWIKVREDQVTRPDGNPGIYGVVSMKNVAIGVLPVHEDGSVTLVGQFRYTLGEYSWEIPEGGCPAGEEPLDAARRELREETGLAASTWEPLGRVHLSNSVCDEVGFLFLATDLEQFAPEPEGTEDLQIRRVSWSEALRMARGGEITDGLSLAAIYRYALDREEFKARPSSLKALTPAAVHWIASGHKQVAQVAASSPSRRSWVEVFSYRSNALVSQMFSDEDATAEDMMEAQRYAPRIFRARWFEVERAILDERQHDLEGDEDCVVWRGEFESDSLIKVDRAVAEWIGGEAQFGAPDRWFPL